MAFATINDVLEYEPFIQEYGIFYFDNAITKSQDDEIIICRCERVTKKEIKDYIKKTGTRDVNAVKAALRVGMGPCGGKTCTDHIIRIFRELGIDPKEIEPHVIRPFTQEVPLKSFLKENNDT